MLIFENNLNRLSPALVAVSSLADERVVAALDALLNAGKCQQMHSIDNAQKFVFKALDYRHGVRREFVRPGKPTDNAFIEAFNRRFRDECLNLHWFDSLDEAQATIETWRLDYNTERPHSALGQQTPAAFSQAWRPSVETTAAD